MLLCLLPALILVGAQTSSPAGPNNTGAADQNCVVTGKVSNSLTGEPLKKVTVRLLPRGGATVRGQSGIRNSADGANAPQERYAALSQADGAFAFENVKPGDYVMDGERTGYLTTQYGARHPMSSGTTFTLKAGDQKSDLNLALIPQGVIVGKVVDEDGDPLNGIMVQAIRQQWMQGKLREMPQGSAQTNDLGEYRLAGMRPGKWYLVAQKVNYDAMDGMAAATTSKPIPAPIRTFYPEAPTREAAAPLEVQAGQDLTGIDIRMHSALTYNVRGKVAGIPAEDKDSGRLMVSLRAAGDSFGYIPASQIGLGKVQTFQIHGVTPGAYELTLRSMGGKSALTGSEQIEVGNGDLNDVILNAHPPALLKGRIQLEGEGAAIDPSSLHIRLLPVDMTMVYGPNPNGSPGTDGAFTLENVNGGEYNLNVVPPSGTYLKSVRLGGREFLGKHLEISNGAAELEIVFRYGAAQINGTATDAEHSGGQTAVSGNVLVVSAEANEDGSGERFSNTDGNGGFSFKQVPPGRYRAYAFADASYSDLQNPDVIKELGSKGVDVDVKENETKQIQLELISASDFDQVLTKLGLERSQ
jgi:hypothetical protein